MLSKFEQLLQELSDKIDISLKVDDNEACAILYDEKITVQLEMDNDEENILVTCSIIELPPGKFRENVLKEALKENNKYPYLASFGYFYDDNCLAAFNYLNFANLNAQILFDYLNVFSEMCFTYHEAITNGQVSPI